MNGILAFEIIKNTLKISIFFFISYHPNLLTNFTETFNLLARNSDMLGSIPDYDTGSPDQGYLLTI